MTQTLKEKPIIGKAHGYRVKRGTSKLRKRIKFLKADKDAFFFECPSLSNETEGPYPLEINTVTGDVWCGCPDFRERHYKHYPKMTDIGHHCKHLVRAMGYLERRDVVDECPAIVQSCKDCKKPHANYGVSDDNGNEIPGQFICDGCVKKLQKPRASDDIITPEEMNDE